VKRPSECNSNSWTVGLKGRCLRQYDLTIIVLMIHLGGRISATKKMQCSSLVVKGSMVGTTNMRLVSRGRGGGVMLTRTTFMSSMGLQQMDSGSIELLALLALCCELND
jgi:hypothetical protein